MTCFVNAVRRFAALLVVAGLLVLAVGCNGSEPKYEPRAGDLIFQSLPRQPVVDMIEGATGSPYSHCGVVIASDQGQMVVLEALGTVKQTPMREYLARGRHGFTVYRFKPTGAVDLDLLIKHARAYEGLPYDFRYRMDDEAIYCSELIYKAYLKTTAKPLGKLVTVAELDWQPYEQTIRQLEAGGPVPLDREMITPRDLARAEALERVWLER